MLKKEEVWCSPNDYIIILQIERPVSTPNALFCFVRVLQPYVNAVCFSSPRIAAMFILKSHRLTPGLFVCYFSQESGSNCEGQLLFWCLAPKQKHQRVLFGKSTRETNSCTGRSTIVFFVFFFRIKCSPVWSTSALPLSWGHHFEQQVIPVHSLMRITLLVMQHVSQQSCKYRSKKKKRKQGARRVGPLWLSGYNMMN